MRSAARHYQNPHETQTRAVCGAALPDGRRCLCPPDLHPETGLPRNGRCVAHGGRSTGPRTEDGRHRAGAGLRAWREARRHRTNNDTSDQAAPAALPLDDDKTGR